GPHRSGPSLRAPRRAGGGGRRGIRERARPLAGPRRRADRRRVPDQASPEATRLGARPRPPPPRDQGTTRGRLRVKIAYVVDVWPKRSETFVVREVEEVARRHDVTIVSLQRPEPDVVVAAPKALEGRAVYLDDVPSGRRDLAL